MKQVHVTAEPVSRTHYVVACSEDDFYVMTTATDVEHVMFSHMRQHGATNLVAH